MKYFILDGDDWCIAYTEDGEKIYEGHSRSEAHRSIAEHNNLQIAFVDTEDVIDGMELTAEQQKRIDDWDEDFYIAQEEFEKRFEE